ncbi:hypothetical protein NL455_28980, partial [Klebsiella pneumoniae]|nr:hypothetical protein [Klebsiella pneumoniae]
LARWSVVCSDAYRELGPLEGVENIISIFCGKGDTREKRFCTLQLSIKNQALKAIVVCAEYSKVLAFGELAARVQISK